MNILRRHILLIAVAAGQVLVAAAAFFLYTIPLPDYCDLAVDSDGGVPWHTMLALTWWYLPSLVAIAAACDLVAFTRKKTSARNVALGAGLVVPALGLALAAHGLFAPLFDASPGGGGGAPPGG
jgi:hypothetical protein